MDVMVEGGLFHHDNDKRFDFAMLRQAARDEVEGSSLITRAANGDRKAATALHEGFWYFVQQFEIAIDRHRLPPHALYAKFGKEGAKEIFRFLRDQVAEMKREEGSHAAHWLKDAENLGLQPEDLENAAVVPGVARLVKSAMTKDHPKFFSVLAGTEFIAEELSGFLLEHRAFTELFGRKRWVWGEVHTIPHDSGPSHLEIDMDLARAYSPSDGDVPKIQMMVADTIQLFGMAADHVEDLFAPKTVTALRAVS